MSRSSPPTTTSAELMPPPPRQRRRLDVSASDAIAADAMDAQPALPQGASTVPASLGQAPHEPSGDVQMTLNRENGRATAAHGDGDADIDGDGDGLERRRPHHRRRSTKKKTSTRFAPLPLDDRPLGPTPSTVYAFGTHENARQAHWKLLRGVVSRALAANDWARAAEAARPRA